MIQQIRTKLFSIIIKIQDNIQDYLSCRARHYILSSISFTIIFLSGITVHWSYSDNQGDRLEKEQEMHRNTHNYNATLKQEIDQLSKEINQYKYIIHNQEEKIKELNDIRLKMLSHEKEIDKSTYNLNYQMIINIKYPDNS